MTTFGSIPGIVIALLIALGVACGYMIWRSLSLPSALRDRRPRCGHCGQEVAQPVPDICPECGVDATLAGVVTPAAVARHRGSLGEAVIAWTLLCVFAGWTFGPSVSNAVVKGVGGGQVRTLNRSITLSTGRVTVIINGRPQQSGTPYSALINANISVPADASPNTKADDGTVTITLDRNSTTLASLEYDVAGQTYRVLDGNGKVVNEGRSLSQTAVDAMYIAAGLDPAAANAAEAQQVFAEADGAIAQPFGPTIRTTVGRTGRTAIIPGAPLPNTRGTMTFSTPSMPSMTMSPLGSGGFFSQSTTASSGTANRTAFLGAKGRDAERIIDVGLTSGAGLLWLAGIGAIYLRRRALIRAATAMPAAIGMLSPLPGGGREQSAEDGATA